VSTHTTRFKPDDTVYVSLLSEQPGSGTVTVRWLLNGQTVSEAKRDVSYTRPAATEFHLQNSGGFPPGNYRVEVLVNGQSAGSRDFRVES
jgi:outer membrane usher protein FimD/PapC